MRSQTLSGGVLEATAQVYLESRVSSPGEKALVTAASGIADGAVQADFSQPGGAMLSDVSQTPLPIGRYPRLYLTKRWGLVGLVVVGLLAALLVVTAQDWSLLGYVGVFLGSLISQATIVVPIPSWPLIVGASAVLSPWAVGLLAGLGGALGELTGYAAGCVSRSIGGGSIRAPRLERLVLRRPALLITAVSMVPNPFVDIVGLLAGRLCLSLPAFLFYTALGKISRNVLLAYLSAWGIASLIAR